MLVLHLLRTAGDATCSVACHSATLRQPAPSPVLRLLWLRTPLPNLPVRASAADAFTEVLLTDCTAGYCELHLRVLLTAAPDHCGPPGPVVSPVTVLQPWLRNSTTAPSCTLQLHTAARQFVSARPCCLSGYKRNHNHTTAQCLLQPEQVFWVRRGGNRPRAAIGHQMESPPRPRKAKRAIGRPDGARARRRGLVDPHDPGRAHFSRALTGAVVGGHDRHGRRHDRARLPLGGGTRAVAESVVEADHERVARKIWRRVGGAISVPARRDFTGDCG
jgi:hypothetical protein